MPTWATVALTLGTGAIGVFGTLVGALFQHRLARHDRQEAEAAAYRQRGAAVLAPVATLLAEADPMRVGVNASPAMHEHLREEWERWRGLRDDLLAYAGAHPSPAVGETAHRLTVAVWNALIMALRVVEDRVQPPGWNRSRMYERALDDHARATELVGLLRAGIRCELADSELAARTLEIEERHEAAVVVIDERSLRDRSDSAG